MNIIIKEQNTVKELYNYICDVEKIKKIPLLFKTVGKGGAKLVFYKNSKCPVSINIDLYGICIGASYALCHEVAHQILVSTEGDARHGSNFKKLEKKLVAKYATCEIARKLVF